MMNTSRGHEILGQAGEKDHNYPGAQVLAHSCKQNLGLAAGEKVKMR